ncbi:hypothetical protein HC725_07385 [Vibrio sp. S17_S38]|uniref:hypothetical protein n=1 Tax=Vibrio sp. S17_S38 TaxID=2720229 RepID=UPI0016815A58|nr:hypothetical protein [Vibrio sp. S17_S38]MBD1573101.1 hypothetical protein [Vibrio sp. S17_S38]
MFLYHSNQSVIYYILKSFLLCVVVAIPTSLILGYFEYFQSESSEENITFYDVLGGGFISPVVEMLMIYVLMSILGLFFESRNTKAIIVAAFISYLHGLVVPFWGVITFFSFFVFSLSYLVWSENKVWLGFFVSISIHFMLNFFSLLFVYFGQFYYL